MSPMSTYTPAQVGKAMLLGVEVCGFFCIGEIIGRGQIVGYRY